MGLQDEGQVNDWTDWDLRCRHDGADWGDRAIGQHGGAWWLDETLSQ